MMFRLHLFPPNFRDILKHVTNVIIPESTTNNLKPVLFLISQCEARFFYSKKRLDCDTSSEDDRNVDIAECLNTVKVVLDITWEHINTGCWKDVDISWRYVYSYASLFKALCLMLVQKPNLKEIVKVCDMGILMGAPILNNILSKIATEIMSFEPETTPINESNLGNVEKKFKPNPEKSIKLGKTVCECRWLSPKDFETSFVKQQKPVLMLGAVRQWPAFSTHKWSIDYILQKARHRTVPVEIGSKYTDENWTQKLMTVEEFITNHVMKNDDAKNVGYLAQHNLFSQIPELMEDIKLPMYIKALWKDDVDVDVNAWFGPGGTISPLHYDPKHNFLVQVMGEKYVKLYGKDQSKFLYPRENTFLSNTSQVDVESPDMDAFPLFEYAQCEECILKPGSMLYIPPECWHYVRSLSVSFSVSFWW